MSCQLTFIIGAPRSGTTLLAKILSQHSDIKAGPEPHLLTPLAHLGVWRNVDKAPYDHIVAGVGQREFVEALPGGMDDYWQACRSYADSLYESFMSSSEKTICLDKTPEYATIWPFLTQVFPDAKFIVLSRHPAAIFSSFANSFFASDFKLSQQHDPLFERYIPAISGFLKTAVPKIHVRYEDLVADPGKEVEAICDFLNIPYYAYLTNYGTGTTTVGQGLGDPIGLHQHSAPSDKRVNRWAEELAADNVKYTYLRTLLRRVDDEDIRRFGYNPDTIWRPVEQLLGSGMPSSEIRHSSSLTTYKLQRKIILVLRLWVQKSPLFKRLILRLKLACEVLVREY